MDSKADVFSAAHDLAADLIKLIEGGLCKQPGLAESIALFALTAVAHNLHACAAIANIEGAEALIAAARCKPDSIEREALHARSAAAAKIRERIEERREAVTHGGSVDKGNG